MKMAVTASYFVPPINMDRVCRICLLEGTNLSPIFCTEQEVDEYSGLPQKIQVCGSIEIHENDGFPSLICDVCIYKASIAHEFRQQCQQSDARLRLLYDPNKSNGSNITESCTQTEPQTRIILTRKMPNPSTTYYVKQELQASNSQDYASAIEAYTDSQVQTVSRTEHPIDCQDDKLFLCNIGFDGAKEMVEKETSIMNVEPPHQVECPIVQTEMTTTLMTVNANGHLETQQLIVKDDSQKCEETPIEEEYLNEQILNENVIDDNIEADSENFEERQQEELLQQQQQGQQEEETMEKRSSSRRVKSASYSEDEMGQDNYFTTIENDTEESDTKPKYKCNICLKRYATQKGLKNHVQVHEKNHKCPVCCKLFYKLKNMENHQKLHETKPHACQTCHASFSKLPSLTRHLKSHEDKCEEESSLACEANDVAKEEMEMLKTDTQSDIETDDETTIAAGTEIDEFENAPGIYKCEVCNQFCSSLKNLKRHSLVHGEKKYSCTVCKKWFFRPDTLKKHAEKHGHGLLDNLVDDNKLFDSDDDNFSNSSIGGHGGRNDTAKSSRDESEDDGVGEYKCQHCDKVMATKKGLRRHVSMHKPKAEPATCEVCKKVCASQARLSLHLKTHNKPKEKVQREYLCHICSKVYPSNSSLTYHMRTHTGVKPHVCKICNSGFTTTTSLANHIRIHTGDKPFVCHVCSAAFAVSSAFRRHLTRHTGEANYLCKTCGKAFKRLSTLKEHTYTHSGEKPYVCKTCGAAYSHSGSLFAHQKRCRVQYSEMIEDHNVAHHIHVNNVQTAVRSLAVIGQMY
ncbi:zinc finger protein 845-like [Venturia canescens]|uniref:zinc finger protein 845-like n=1 Tax=Venturia canescens TaxID=32260 RepID=UPI001C9C7579|nr:zinc finger protein 845-like [Venturia canescens]